MSTSDTLVLQHHHTLLGTSALGSIVRLEKVDFCSFCLARANSSASKRHRPALYPSTLAGPSYHLVKELSHWDQPCVSYRARCAKSKVKKSCRPRRVNPSLAGGLQYRPHSFDQVFRLHAVMLKVDNNMYEQSMVKRLRDRRESMGRGTGELGKRCKCNSFASDFLAGGCSACNPFPPERARSCEWQRLHAVAVSVLHACGAYHRLEVASATRA